MLAARACSWLTKARMVQWLDECHILEELCSRNSHDELVKRTVLVLKWLALVRACARRRM